MVIRCERCSTLYELDEALLSPAGSQVQCTRCQHVFTAFPPRAAGRTLVGVPAQAAPAERSVAHPAASRPAASAAAAGGGAAAAGPASGPTRHDTPRPVRSGPPPVYHPAMNAALPTAGHAPLLKRDTVGTFEARLRWSARWRWLAPLLAVGTVAVAVAAWSLLARRGDSDASRTRSDALSLVALDDAESVEQAITRLDAVLRRTPKDPVAACDRALAYVLRAAALLEEGEGLAGRLATRNAERERLRRDQPAGWEDAERAAAADVQKLEPEVRAREERARSLGSAAFQLLRRLQAEQGDTPEVSRGLAAYYALGGERERARKTIRAARERTPADPWLDLAEGWVDARDPDRSARERALAELGALSTAHPELIRARYLLARAQAALGRSREAVATLDGLLAANGRHEAGMRLREELTAPPPPPPPAPAPEVKPPPKPRKLVTRPAPAPSASPVPDAGERAVAGPDASAPGAPPSAPPAAATPPGAPAVTPPAGAEVEPPPRKSEPRREPPPPPGTLDGG